MNINFTIPDIWLGFCARNITGVLALIGLLQWSHKVTKGSDQYQDEDQ